MSWALFWLLLASFVAGGVLGCAIALMIAQNWLARAIEHYLLPDESWERVQAYIRERQQERDKHHENK